MPRALSHIDTLAARARARVRAATMDARPRLRSVILTCMDARIDPAALFDLKPGEVHVLRNAGARVTPDVLRSLAVSQSLLGTNEVLVLGHTECGLLERTEEEVASAIERLSGHRPSTPVGTFKDLEAAVHESVETIRNFRFLAPETEVRGYILDVRHGVVRALGEKVAEGRARISASMPLGLHALSSDVLNLKRKG